MHLGDLQLLLARQLEARLLVRQLHLHAAGLLVAVHAHPATGAPLFAPLSAHARQRVETSHAVLARHQREAIRCALLHGRFIQHTGRNAVRLECGVSVQRIDRHESVVSAGPARQVEKELSLGEWQMQRTRGVVAQELRAATTAPAADLRDPEIGGICAIADLVDVERRREERRRDECAVHAQRPLLPSREASKRTRATESALSTR